MIGKKDEMDDMFHYFRMHELVPDDHILKLIDKHIDFSFVRESMSGSGGQALNMQ